MLDRRDRTDELDRRCRRSTREDVPIVHCEEGAALCCEVGWGLNCAARHRGNEEVVTILREGWEMTKGR